jgi:two-component system KDP operon response regulator KdpE
MSRVLIIDDELPIRKFLRISLGAQAFEVVEASNAVEALKEATEREPDIILLDLGLPDTDGKDLIFAIRAITTVPIIVLSIRATEQEKIAALDAGASDYVTKPFALGELTARIRAQLRDRYPDHPADAVFQTGSLRVDVPKHQVRLGDREIRLTPKEFDLLALLLAHRGKVVTHSQLLREVWGKSHEGDTQYLRVYIGQLRQKLGDDPAHPRYIANEPGLGYRFLDPD